MRVLLSLTMIMILLFSGCSLSKSELNWDYQKGYVISKDKNDSRLLVVPTKPKKNLTIKEVLQEYKPDAIWVKINDTQVFDSINLYDKVEIKYVDGMIDQSYPCQGTAETIAKIK